MSQLIGLTGLKRSGKDTVAAHLVEHHGFVRVAFADPVKQALVDLNPYVTKPTEDHRVSQLYAEIGYLEQRIAKAFQRNTVCTLRSSHVTMAVRRLDPMLAGDQRMDEVLHSVDGDWDRLKEGSTDADADTVAEIRRLQQLLGTEVGRHLVKDTIWVDTAMAAIEAHHNDGAAVVVSDVRFDNEAQAIRDAGGTVLRVDRPSLSDGPIDGHASEQGVDADLVDDVIVNDGTLEDLYAITDQLISAVRA